MNRIKILSLEGSVVKHILVVRFPWKYFNVVLKSIAKIGTSVSECKCQLSIIVFFIEHVCRNILKPLKSKKIKYFKINLV